MVEGTSCAVPDILKRPADGRSSMLPVGSCAVSYDAQRSMVMFAVFWHTLKLVVALGPKAYAYARTAAED